MYCVYILHTYTHVFAHVYYIYTDMHAYNWYTKHSALYLTVMKYLFILMDMHYFFSPTDYMSLFSLCIYQQPDPYGTEEM